MAEVIPKKYVTLVSITSNQDKVVTMELWSDTVEEAFAKEQTYKKIEEQENIKSVQLIGTYKNVTLDLKVVEK